MSLLTDYEELSQSQELGIFKEVLDETLKPLLIYIDEKFFKMRIDVNEVEMKLNNLKSDLQQRIEELKLEQQTEINETSQQSRAYYHNLFKELSALSSDVESIKQSLNK
jgi:hypothetical protein